MKRIITKRRDRHKNESGKVFSSSVINDAELNLEL